MSVADKPVPAPRNGEAQAASIPAIDSKELFRGNRQVQILHAGQTYILRQTRDNKLILTK